MYDMNGLTAAHREMPFGTRIRVTNLTNNRYLVLRVNDRGPGIPGRLLDVSMAAAEHLGFLGEGLAPVRIEVLETPEKRHN
jgi:rare lipoprotein A